MRLKKKNILTNKTKGFTSGKTTSVRKLKSLISELRSECLKVEKTNIMVCFFRPLCEILFKTV